MRERVTGRQGTRAAFGGLLSLSVAAAGSDWRGALLAVPVAVLAGWCWSRLSEIEGARCGWPRGPIASLYIIWCITLAGAVLGGAGERVTASLERDTGWVILLIWLPSLWLALGRPQVFGRAAEVFCLVGAAALGAVVLLSLGQVEWDRLLTPTGKLGESFLTAVGVSCCAAVAALTEGREERRGAWVGWSAACAGALAVICAVTAGVLGPTLAQTQERPFFLLCVGLSRTARVEGLVSAVWLVADTALLGLLFQTGRRMWQSMGLPTPGVGGAVTALAALAVGLWLGLTGRADRWLRQVVPLTGLILGGALPAAVLLWQKGRNRFGRGAHFGVEDPREGEDIGA